MSQLRSRLRTKKLRMKSLLEMFPLMSGDCLAKNSVQPIVGAPKGIQSDHYEANHQRKIPHPFPQSALCNESVAATKGKNRNPERCLVRITSFRCRLTDPDNLCPKYFIDSLRYASAIPDDRQEDIILETRQEKVKSYAQERTVIEIET